MQVSGPIPEATVMVGDDGRKPRPLRFRTRAEIYALIDVLEQAAELLPPDDEPGESEAGESEAGDDTAAPVDEHHPADVAATVDALAIPANRIGEPAPLPLCGKSSPESLASGCARFAGHRPPCRDLNGYEYNDVDPRHAAVLGEPRCEAYDDNNGEGRICNAQAGHGGDEHLMYGDFGAIVHRWPIAADDKPAPRPLNALRALRAQRTRSTACKRTDRHGPHGVCPGHLGAAAVSEPGTRQI